MIVSEGANTMDIGRGYLPNELPRRRLDAGSFGTMGVGLGFAIAAAVWLQKEKSDQRVYCVEGDSAFGFSGMEVGDMQKFDSRKFSIFETFVFRWKPLCATIYP